MDLVQTQHFVHHRKNQASLHLYRSTTSRVLHISVPTFLLSFTSSSALHSVTYAFSTSFSDLHDSTSLKLSEAYRPGLTNISILFLLFPSWSLQYLVTLSYIPPRISFCFNFQKHQSILLFLHHFYFSLNDF